ncbi:MAG: gliding motility-associated C-terminal domain-containing protein [Bacteroidales bacterium]|jgi:hypothetical protein|nr:gliding motility-associated C-terminal domain-containing protein [Bacteroidales bacterium]
MLKKILTSILFSLIIFTVYSQNNTVKLNLEAGSDNTSVSVGWEIPSHINPVNLDIYMMDNINQAFSLIESIPNPANNFATVINIILSDFTFHFTAQLTDSQSNIYHSDTLSPIYMTLGGGSISQPHPTIRCPKYPLIAPDTLYLYRKYPYDQTFIRINPQIETGTSFIDNTLTAVCDTNISYYVINKAGNSVSAIKSARYTDPNPPDKPMIRGLTVNDNGDLIIQWHHSTDIDVEFYKIDTILPYGTWQNKDSIPANQTSYVLMKDFCSYNSDFSIQYRVLAVDSCGNSTVWDLDEIAYNPMILNIPYVHECNSVRFSWNNANCISGNINNYFIILNDLNEQTTDTITFNNNNIISEPNENTYYCNINRFNANTSYQCLLYAVNDQQPPDTVRTCAVDFYVGNIPNAPDTLSILGIKYETQSGNNIIDIYVDPEPGKDVEYILYTNPRNNSDGVLKQDTIAIISSDQFPLESGNLTFRDNMQVSSAYNYYLVAKNSCGTSFIDSSFMKSIYLMGEEDSDSHMFRLCFSQNITNYEYDEITYTVHREYFSTNSNEPNEDNIDWMSCNTTPVGSQEFCTYCQTNSPDAVYNYCDYDMDFYYGEDNFSITWHIETEITHINGETSISISNPVTLYASVRMPNAFIPNAINEVNSRFGPLNFSPYNSQDIQSIDFQIFNSWGERIWYGKDIFIDFYWTGKTVNGKDAPAGVYLYIYTITFKNGLSFKTQGSVNLIRH